MRTDGNAPDAFAAIGSPPRIRWSMPLFENRTVRTSRSSTRGRSALAHPGLLALRLAATLVALAVFVLARSAAAQIGTGTLTGQVVDASSKRALADVVVTATSPALQGEQTVVTDSSGSF